MDSNAVRIATAGWTRHCADVDAWEVEQKAIARRADEQHAWTLAGDERGIYGT
jgi:hypothetical protein